MKERSLLVVCLCADWCSSCREYRQAAYAECTRLFPACRFEWLDVEEDADLLGDLDIENFPTLLIARDDQALFFGALMPHAEHLRRLLETLLDGASAPAVSVAVSADLGRITRHYQPEAG